MKKKMSAIALLLVLVMILSLGLVACNDGNGGGNTPAPPAYDPNKDGEKVENVNWGELTSFNQYFDKFMTASKSTQAPELTEDDAFVANTYFDLNLDKVRDGFRKTNIKVGIGIEVGFDRVHLENSYIKFAITDKAKPHEILVTATLKDPENIYIDYLGQKIKFAYNNGIVEKHNLEDQWYPLTVLENVLGTDLSAIIQTIVQPISLIIIPDDLFPMLHGETLPNYKAENKDKFDLNMVLNAFLNLPLYTGDVAPAAKDYNVFTPINRIIDALEVVPWALNKAMTTEDGLTQIVKDSKLIEGLLDKLPEGMDKVVNTILGFLPGILGNLLPNLTKDDITNIMDGNVDATILERAQVNVGGVIQVLTKGDLSFALPVLFDDEKNKLIFMSDGSKQYELVLGSMITQMLAKGTDVGINFNTNGTGKVLNNLGIRLTTTEGQTKTNVVVKIAPTKITKVDGASKIANVVAELADYSADWSVDSHAQLEVKGIKLQNVDLSGIYDIKIVGALDFTKTANNNMYASLSNGQDTMLEVALKGEDLSIKLGKDAKTIAIMDKAMPLIKNAMISNITTQKQGFISKKTKLEENITHVPAEDTETIASMKKQIKYCEDAIKGLTERETVVNTQILGRMMNADGTYNKDFSGIKVTGINFAKLFNKAMQETTAPLVIIGGDSFKGVETMDVLDIVSGIASILNKNILEDPAINKFVDIKDMSIAAFIKKVPKDLALILNKDVNVLTTAYIYATNPKYVAAFAPIFAENNPTVAQSQYELMYMFLTEPEAYKYYTACFDAIKAYKELPNKETNEIGITNIYNIFKNNVPVNALIPTRDNFVILAQESKLNTEVMISETAFNEMIAGNPVNKALNILEGSAFFRDARNLISNTLFKGTVSLDFKVTGNSAEFNTKISVKDAYVKYGCTFSISAKAPGTVPPVELGSDPYVKEITYSEATNNALK